MTSQEEEYRELQEENIDSQRTGEELPQLYSKRLILIFALIFSTIFAAVLLMSNLKSLDKRRESYLVLFFTVFYMMVSVILIQVLGLPPDLTFVANVIGAAILNEFFWNKYIGRDREFQKKSWVKPAIVSLLISIPFVIGLMGSL
ncbi:MAG: hypothetical protein WBV47_00580 [Salegentibacter sp.]